VISLPTADVFHREQSATARIAFVVLLALLVAGAATTFIRPPLAVALLILPIGLVLVWF